MRLHWRLCVLWVQLTEMVVWLLMTFIMGYAAMMVFPLFLGFAEFLSAMWWLAWVGRPTQPPGTTPQEIARRYREGIRELLERPPRSRELLLELLLA